MIHVQLTCTACDHHGSVDGEALSQRLGELLTYSNIAEFSGEFKCRTCGSMAVLVKDDQGVLLLDPSNTRSCQVCDQLFSPAFKRCQMHRYVNLAQRMANSPRGLRHTQRRLQNCQLVQGARSRLWCGKTLRMECFSLAVRLIQNVVGLRNYRKGGHDH